VIRLQHPEAYVSNKSGFLGLKLDPALPYRLRYAEGSLCAAGVDGVDVL